MRGTLGAHNTQHRAPTTYNVYQCLVDLAREAITKAPESQEAQLDYIIARASRERVLLHGLMREGARSFKHLIERSDRRQAERMAREFAKRGGFIGTTGSELEERFRAYLKNKWRIHGVSILDARKKDLEDAAMHARRAERGFGRKAAFYAALAAKVGTRRVVDAFTLEEIASIWAHISGGKRTQ